ncbi:MAG: UbiD family decarboxylase [Clostridia bacterium]|nr:UbiD family decarboxylase [Clostridia bacterium]MDQ7792606.1 UbiD family decarboxylase [Clostridia bacterium]
MALRNLREFIDLLRQNRQLTVIEAEVDPYLELAEIHRRVIAENGPALLFKKVKGSPFPVLTNMFGTVERIEMAFGPRPKELVREAVEMAEALMPPRLAKLWKYRHLTQDLRRLGTRKVRRGPVTEAVQKPPRLDKLPMLTSWPDDGGPFLTLPLVYTEHPENGKHNLGMYRVQRYDAATTGMHWQIQKGGGFHYHVAEGRDEPLPVTVFLGGPPALILSAIAPLPEDIGELILASMLGGHRLEMASNPLGGHRLIAEAEFAIVGKVPPRERRPEGPFGDHYGYYSLQHDYPVFNIDAVFHRKDAIYPATVVGKPRQEDFFIGDYLQELMSPLFPMVMPSVCDLWSYGETGFHSLTAAVVRERYSREALGAAFRILGEGQLTLTKFLMLTDTPRDLCDFRGLLEHLLARVRWEQDFFILDNLAMDTLDYSGPAINRGSKAILMGLGHARRELPRAFTGTPPQGVQAVNVFCPGCLVVAGETHGESPDLGQHLARDPALADWPLVILADDAGIAAREMDFLWAVFTRFEPAADIYAATTEVRRHHLNYAPPIVIDARMKATYPGTVEPLPETVELVDRRWKEYFPG